MTEKITVFHTDYSAHGLEPANPGKIPVGEKYTLACSDPTHVTTHFNTLDIGKGARTAFSTVVSC